MNNEAPFSLSSTRVLLSDGPGVEQLRMDAGLWKRLETDPQLRTGRMLGVHGVKTDDDVHASTWERHSKGDELLCLVSGRIDVVLDESSGERVVPLEPLTGLIVPQGVWHRLHVKEPAVLVGVTRHDDTQHREVRPGRSAGDDWNREVFPHSELVPLAANLWVVRGQFPGSPLPRNMIVYRYGDSLLLHSVVALDERSMRDLEALGKPSIMMIPNWDHYAHIVAFKRRYPELTVVCPAASRAKVEERLAVDATCEEFFPRHGMRFVAPPGMDPVEGVLELPLEAGRVAIMMNDLITNVPHQPGLRGLLLRATGSSGRPRVIPIVRRRLKIERPVMRGYLEELARRRDVALLTTSHGDCVRSDVSTVIAAVARDLG